MMSAGQSNYFPRLLGRAALAAPLLSLIVLHSAPGWAAEQKPDDTGFRLSLGTPLLVVASGESTEGGVTVSVDETTVGLPGAGALLGLSLVASPQVALGAEFFVASQSTETAVAVEQGSTGFNSPGGFEVEGTPVTTTLVGIAPTLELAFANGEGARGYALLQGFYSSGHTESGELSSVLSQLGASLGIGVDAWVLENASLGARFKGTYGSTSLRQLGSSQEQSVAATGIGIDVRLSLWFGGDTQAEATPGQVETTDPYFEPSRSQAGLPATQSTVAAPPPTQSPTPEVETPPQQESTPLRLNLPGGSMLRIVPDPSQNTESLGVLLTVPASGTSEPCEAAHFRVDDNQYEIDALQSGRTHKGNQELFALRGTVTLATLYQVSKPADDTKVELVVCGQHHELGTFERDRLLELVKKFRRDTKRAEFLEEPSEP